jgi:hypothetical protein
MMASIDLKNIQNGSKQASAVSMRKIRQVMMASIVLRISKMDLNYDYESGKYQ